MTDLTNTELSLDNTTDTSAEQYDPAHDYHALNAMLNLYDADGKIQFDKDKAAEREYVTGHVAANSKQFDSTAERLDYLISNQYYNPAVFNQYSAEFLDRIYEHVESAGFEFGTFLGAFKFYTSYALKTFDGRLYLEDFPQRCTAVALELAAGNEQQAIEYADEMLAGRFQPATPTFLNLGKAQRGEPVSCFLVRIEDNMESISREKIRIKSLALGVVIPDITFELAKQKAQMALFSPYDVERVYGKPFADISVSEHYDEMVADDRIKKTYIDARKFFTTIAELQFESGYPYIVFEDTVNRANPIEGRVTMSNLCSEILQVQEPSAYNEDLTYAHVGRDISCNLGSLNIAKAIDGGLAYTVETAIRALTSVAEHTSIDAVPSIRRANEEGHAIGLGQMNLHGFLAREGIHYGSEEGLDFTDMYFMTVAYHAYRASHALAVEHGHPFKSFATSDYAKPAGQGNYFDKYTDGRRSLEPRTAKVRELFAKYGIEIPTVSDWETLRDAILKDGIYNQNLQAVPPTGSISYINHSTSSIHPIASKIEIRKEGKIGRVYYPAAYMTNDNLEYYKDAYEIGWKAIVDTYAEATQHVDQGLSLTLFFPDTATTRDLNKAQIYAWRKGIKTLYYIRIRQQALEGTEVQGCVSCML